MSISIGVFSFFFNGFCFFLVSQHLSISDPSEAKKSRFFFFLFYYSFYLAEIDSSVRLALHTGRSYFLEYTLEAFSRERAHRHRAFVKKSPRGCIIVIYEHGVGVGVYIESGR
ncbi:hypothetical protein F4781DRAFT_170590 [Annulohypoxylon bovei var. microspora]|nr:hypothetical protein F4781DRAFT_170590 [Annulohypoxylon bovei var. microspora]